MLIQSLRLNTADANSDMPSIMQHCVQIHADALNQLHEGWGETIIKHPLKTQTVSQRSVIIGGGMGTTGTKSLHAALKLLGLNVWHAGRNSTWDARRNDVTYLLKTGQAKEIHNFDFVGLLDGADGAIDCPTAEVFIDLFLSFPNAKVVLSTRPPQSWAASRLKHHSGTLVPKQEPFGAQIGSKGFESIETLAKLYQINNDFVRCVVPKQQLLEYDLWADNPDRIRGLLKEIQNFAGGSSDPDVPFPHKQFVAQAVRWVDMDTEEECEAEFDMDKEASNLNVDEFGVQMALQATNNCEAELDESTATFNFER